MVGATANQKGLGNVQAIALDSSSDVYVAGSYSGTAAFAATPGVFQSGPRPAVPVLNYQPLPGGGSDAFVAKFDSSLTHLLAATLIGGESADGGSSIAVDAAGNVIVGGFTDSLGFPTHAPFQTSFAARSGFVAGFDPTLSHLEFSTYLGDAPFTALAAYPDGAGNVLVAGYTLSQSGGFLVSDNGNSFTGWRNFPPYPDGGPAPAEARSYSPPLALRLAGPGRYTLSNGYAVAALPKSVFLDDGIYCDGIAAIAGPVADCPATSTRSASTSLQYHK